MKCVSCEEKRCWDCRRTFCKCGCTPESARILKIELGYEQIEIRAKIIIDALIAEFGEIDLNEFPLEAEIAKYASGEVAQCAWRFASCRFSDPEYV